MLLAARRRCHTPGDRGGPPQRSADNPEVTWRAAAPCAGPLARRSHLDAAKQGDEAMRRGVALALLCGILGFTVGPARAAELILSREGKNPFKLDPASGNIYLANGTLVARFDRADGSVWYYQTDPQTRQTQGSVVGHLTAAGVVEENGVELGSVTEDGRLIKDGSVVGRIEDAGAVLRDGAKWAQVSGCCAEAGQKRMVAAFVAFFTSDF